MAPINFQHLDVSILLFEAFLKTHLNAHKDALTLTVTNRGTKVRRILSDPKSSTDLIFLTILKAMKLVLTHRPPKEDPYWLQWGANLLPERVRPANDRGLCHPQSHLHGG